LKFPKLIVTVVRDIEVPSVPFVSEILGSLRKSPRIYGMRHFDKVVTI
jgi:hypothetical protein